MTYFDILLFPHLMFHCKAFSQVVKDSSWHYSSWLYKNKDPPELWWMASSDLPSPGGIWAGSSSYQSEMLWKGILWWVEGCRAWGIFCCCAVAQSYPTLCGPMDCSTPGFPVLHLVKSGSSHRNHCPLSRACPLRPGRCQVYGRPGDCESHFCHCLLATS